MFTAMWLKALVATTCVAILMTIGWLAWTEYGRAEERAVRKAIIDCIDEQMQSIEGMTAELARLQCAFIVE